MKIIFLDIDGVMNDELAYREWQNNPDKDTFADSDLPTDKHMAQLKQIVSRTGAFVVLSSSWRCSNYGIRAVLERFFEYGIILFSITQEGVSESVLEGFDVEPKNTGRTPWDHALVVYDRGAEIAGWLRAHKNIESFVILDDEGQDIRPYFPNNFIETSFMTGLTDEDVEKSIEILNNKNV